MSESLMTVSYLAASVLFILSLGGLSHQETARRGNLFGIIGIIVAMVATAFDPRVESYGLLLATIAAGSVIGIIVALRVQMTAMPQLVAILHSFVGLAAVMVGVGSVVAGSGLTGAEHVIHNIEIFLGVFIGAITFTGSIVAFGKLQGFIGSKPLLLPARHMLNLSLVLLSLALGVGFIAIGGEGLTPLIVMTLIAFFIGWHMVMAIGGADMPVVVSMLNSYSGWAAAATGFMLKNDLLIVTGALVGSSGAILSYIMRRAMNRSFVSVILGGFGGQDAPSQSGKTADTATEVKASSAEDVVQMLKQSRNVVVVPGYGLAVAQAQHPLREIFSKLKDSSINMRFAIHPVAGRLPGHMNVLLAEANVPYDQVLEMDEINADFPETDVVLVIGANDIVNPGAQDDASSPIYGMPVLEAWKAKTVVVLKRSMGTGYSGIDNPLFYKPNTKMLFGDAKQSVHAILAGL